jgi:hypothetical protein
VIITAYVIAALVGLGIIYIGVSYLFAPMTVAPAFGVHGATAVVMLVAAALLWLG